MLSKISGSLEVFLRLDVQLKKEKNMFENVAGKAWWSAGINCRYDESSYIFHKSASKLGFQINLARGQRSKKESNEGGDGWGNWCFIACTAERTL